MRTPKGSPTHAIVVQIGAEVADFVMMTLRRILNDGVARTL